MFIAVLLDYVEAGYCSASFSSSRTYCGIFEYCCVSHTRAYCCDYDTYYGYTDHTLPMWVFDKPLKRRCISVADPGGPGDGSPLTPIFEAPDYILRPKLRIFWVDQSWAPPWPNPESVAVFNSVWEWAFWLIWHCQNEPI